MQTISFNDLLTSIHYLHSPLWGSVLHTMNVLSLFLAIFYAISTQNCVKKKRIFIIYQSIYFIVLVAETLVYGPFILRIGSVYFYEFIFELINFALPMILVIIVSRKKRKEAPTTTHK